MGQFESRFAKWVVAARWLVLGASLALAAASTAGGQFLKFNSDFRAFFSEDNPELLAFESLEKTYEKSDTVVFLIVPEDGDATSEESLEAAVWITERAWQRPFSRRVESIVNFPHVTAEGDDIAVRDLVNPAILGDAEERARIRGAALGDPRLAGSVLALDGSASAVVATVQLPEAEQEARIPEITAFARGVAAEAEERFSGIDVRLVGTVILTNAFSEASISSLGTIFPVALALMALVLCILTRGILGAAATGLVVLLAVVAAMGLGGWARLPFTAPIAAVPTIVLTVAVASCVHLIVAFQQRLRAGDSRHNAAIESLRVNLQPVFLASLTTALGFLSLNFSEVPPYRHLGTYVALGVGASFVLSVTFLPALLALLPFRAPRGGGRADPAMAALGEFVVRRRTILLWGSAAAVLALLAAVPRNELNDVLVHFFDDSVELRRDTDFVDARLSGNTVLEYSLVASEPGGIADPAYLEDVAAFADWFRGQPETRHVLAISDTFRHLNQMMQGGGPEAYTLPASRELGSQYLFLYELSLPPGLDLSNRIDVARSATRMTVSAVSLSSQAAIALNERAEAWVAGNAPNIVEAEGSGGALIFAHLGQRNIKAMVLGTTVALLCISLLLIAALRSLRLGLVSLVPNFAPAAMGFGIWGLTEAEIGVALSVVMAMTIGIVVDDTVHFLSKYRRARHELGRAPEDAVRYAMRTVGWAMVTTTAVLVAGFLVLTLSPFVPTASTGLLTTLIIALALAADLLLLPPLLMAADREGRGKASAQPAS